MKKAKILYVSQEIVPFFPESEIASKSRQLPQKSNEFGRETRIFMPRFGSINERRHQLHEVIRLSGMNLIINDTDHPLIIKVATVPTARMQVYFIDNDEFFKRRFTTRDAEDKFFADNDERAMFFCKGVIETVKKLGWTPDIVHCHGWMTAAMPLYLKKIFHDDPHFLETKVVYSLYNKDLEEGISAKCADKFVFDGLDKKDPTALKGNTIESLNKLGMQFSDGIIKGSEAFTPDLEKFISGLDKPVLDYQDPENYFDAYNTFYENIMEETTVLAQ